MRTRIEDGMGCSGVVPTKSEQSAEDAFRCERDAFERMETTLRREIEKLRRIAAHVPAGVYIKAKEEAGYGEAVRAKEQ